MSEAPEDSLTELLAEVRRIEVQSRRLVSEGVAGGYASVFRGMGVELDEVREYEEGDDPRTVDWNVTARMGRPFVKKFVDERELTVLFLLDLSASMEGGLGLWSARQAAARVVACLGLAAVQNGDRIGLIAFSGDVERFVPPRKGRRHALRIVRDALALRGSSARTDLRPPLELCGRLVRRRAVLFLVSDFLAEGYQDALRLCARRHDLVAVRLLTPELGAGGDALAARPERLLVNARDPEAGTRTLLDLGDDAAGASGPERVAAWRARTEVELARAGVDRLDVPIPRAPGRDTIARPILSFFRLRELRGRR